MVTEKKTSAEESIEAVEQSLSRTEQFIENHLKTILIVVVAVLIVFGGFFSYKSFYLKPLEEEAKGQMFKAEENFKNNNFELALNGNGNDLGFIQITEDYSATDAANLAHYYAGRCFLNSGKFEQAISHFENFNGKDILISAFAIGGAGDAYVELNNLEKGVSKYMDAATSSDNTLTAPMFFMKAGQIYEELKNYKKAIDAYSSIKQDKFKKTKEYNAVEKYISRAKVKGNL